MVSAWWRQFKRERLGHGNSIDLHEVREEASQLQENTEGVRQAAKPYLDAENPLFSLMATLVNRQQMD